MSIQLPFPELLPNSNWRMPDKFPSFRDEKWLSLDLETHDPNLRTKGPGFIRGDAKVVGVAIHVEGFSGYYPVRHLQGNNFAPNVVFDWLKDEASHFRGKLFGANLLYDEEGLWSEGVTFHDDVSRCDVQMCEALIDEETAEGYSLEVISNKYLGHGKEEHLLKDASQMHTKGYKDKRAKRPIPFDPKGDLWMLAPEYVGEYAETDVGNPRKIFLDHQSKIFDREHLWKIFDLESSLIPILLKMRIKGVRVDLEAAHNLVTLLSREIENYSGRIKQLVGFYPNLDSGQDVSRAYEVLGARMPELNISSKLKYTSLGNPSFTSEWYSMQQDPLSSLIRKAKKLLTLRDDFVIGDVIKEQVNGRIHCQFTQLRQDDSGTRSGRMASKNPNLQQVPARHDKDLWGKDSKNWADEVRKLFVADQGMHYLKSDVSQQEPRLLVHFAALCNLPGADAAVAAFRRDPRTDYHQLTTNIVNETCGRSYRRAQIKGINLGIVYGMGLKKLCRMLNLSENEGKEILAAYHEALPFVRGLSSKVMSVVESRGFVNTIEMRRRRFNLWEVVPNRDEDIWVKQGLPRDQAEAKWPGRKLRRFGLHKAMNALIQGSAADQTKKMMQILYYQYGKIAHLQVHDELGFSIADAREGFLIKSQMENAIKLEIPVVCDAMYGPSWGEAKMEVAA